MAKIEIPKARPEGVRYIEMILKIKKIEFVTELKFHEKRRFRFDFAIPAEKIAIEYEGISVGKGGKSRHTSITGYTRDCEKYNLAAVDGWRVLRFTALNYKDIFLTLEALGY